MNYPASWTCERTRLQFEQYLLSTLVLSEALAVAEHLEACEGCVHHLVSYRMILARPRG